MGVPDHKAKRKNMKASILQSTLRPKPRLQPLSSDPRWEMRTLAAGIRLQAWILEANLEAYIPKVPLHAVLGFGVVRFLQAL